MIERPIFEAIPRVGHQTVVTELEKELSSRDKDHSRDPSLADL